MKKEYVAPEFRLLAFCTEAIANFIDGSIGVEDNEFPEEE